MGQADNTTPSFRALDSAGTTDDESVLDLIHQAGNPYFDFLFGGYAETHQVLHTWYSRPSSEIARANCTGMFEDRRLIGIYIGLDADQLRKTRRADLFALFMVKHLDSEMLKARLAATRELFPPVETGAWYLSKFGVAGPFRGHGWGRILLDHFQQEGARRGCTTLCLDVCSDNTPAIQLYERFGFTVQSRYSSSGDAIMQYLRYVKRV